jgi:hypothetical protein
MSAWFELSAGTPGWTHLNAQLLKLTREVLE